MKKLLAVCLILMLVFLAALAGAELYRDLKKGDQGDDVLMLKKTLKELGYLKVNKLSDQYNADTEAGVRAFQTKNSLPETGIADPMTQALLLSGAALNKDGVCRDPEDVPSAEDFGSGEFRDLEEGCSGNDVQALKNGMYRMGFYGSNSGNAEYNASLTKRVKEMQQALGLEQTGKASAALQRLVLKEQPTAAPKATKTPKPTRTPKPTATPKPTRTPGPTVSPKVPVDLPETDERGFLSDTEAQPFIVEDRDDGHWIYIGRDLRVEICRFEDKSGKIVWYEADVRTGEETGFIPLLMEGGRKPGHNYADPITIAEKYRAVFAVTDDNFGERWYRTVQEKKKGNYEGPIVRGGEILADILPPEGFTGFPNLDVMVCYPDGSLQFDFAREHTAQEYLDMGASSTWAFGPILLKDGQDNPYLTDKNSKSYTEHMAKEPRMAIGYYEKGHYVFITVTGRTSTSDGVTLPWLADRFRKLGVRDAFNFDGGNTAVMCFMGKAVNKSEKVDRTKLRQVTSMLSVGVIGE